MKTVVLLFIMALLALTASGQSMSGEMEQKSGSVCVLPNSPERPTRISPGGDYNPATLRIRVDTREPILWPHRKPTLIDDLDAEQSHMVVLTSDGKRIQSFRFKFSEEHDDKLCIYYDGYQGVQLGNRRDALWCKVASRKCWK